MAKFAVVGEIELAGDQEQGQYAEGGCCILLAEQQLIHMLQKGYTMYSSHICCIYSSLDIFLNKSTLITCLSYRPFVYHQKELKYSAF